MNFQQLEYILAVDHYRHFVTTAQHCHVTQATLSMMIKKTGRRTPDKIFDRSRQPVIPTEWDKNHSPGQGGFAGRPPASSTSYKMNQTWYRRTTHRHHSNSRALLTATLPRSIFAKISRDQAADKRTDNRCYH